MCQTTDTASRHVTPHPYSRKTQTRPRRHRTATHGCGPHQTGWRGPHPFSYRPVLLPGPRTQTERHITERPQRANDQTDHDTDLDPLPHETTPRPDPPPQRPENPAHSRHDGRSGRPETIPNKHNSLPFSLHPHNTRPLRQKSLTTDGAPGRTGREHPIRVAFALVTRVLRMSGFHSESDRHFTRTDSVQGVSTSAARKAGICPNDSCGGAPTSQRLGPHHISPATAGCNID